MYYKWKGIHCSASWIIVVWLILFVSATGELNITDIALTPENKVHLKFGDSNPPVPYVLEYRPSLEDDIPWTPFHGLDIRCLRPPLLETTVPSAIPDPRFYRISVASGSSPPVVVATEPADGATGVASDLASVKISFNQPMAATTSIEASQQWGASYVLWENDHRTAVIHRLNSQDKLPKLAHLGFTVNPEGQGFADLSGQYVAAYHFSFSTGSSQTSGPYVVSSYPANNDMQADPWIDTVEFHFSEPMLEGGGFESSNWYPWTLTWSEDKRIAYVFSHATVPLFGREVFLRTLNLHSAAGVPMETDYALTFRTQMPEAVRVEADPAKGFYWPYYLLTPPTIQAPGTLLLETNNTGNVYDDLWIHEEAAKKTIQRLSSFAIRLGTPLLVPVFPRPQSPRSPDMGDLYVHALDRYSLGNQWPGLQRIDLQLIAIIDDALRRLREEDHIMDNRVFMMGFSASGAFTSRFAILHPERLKAAAPGSPGGWPTAPVASWQGTPLKYPMGIQDLPSLINQSFDLDTFRQLPLFIYVGSVDTNDAFDTRGMNEEEKNLVYQFLNWPNDPILANRWPLAQTIYDSVGANATFKVYPGVAHTISDAMWDDILDFFRQYR